MLDSKPMVRSFTNATMPEAQAASESAHQVESLRAEKPSGPLTSVIIPCFNQAKFLSTTLQSVLQQTYSHLEILVVDDGSKDDTQQVASAYDKVRCIHQSNQGLASARNTGFRNSLGEFILFLDADDRLTQRAVETNLQLLLDHPEWAFVAGRYSLIDQHGRPSGDSRTQSPEEFSYRSLLLGNFIGAPNSVLYRRSALQEVGCFSQAYPGCEDYDLYLRLAQRWPFFCHSEPVAEYRQHGSNMSGNAQLMLRNSVRVLKANRGYVGSNQDLLRAYQTGLGFWRRLYGVRLAYQIRGWLKSGQVVRAFHGLGSLLRYVGIPTLAKFSLHGLITAGQGNRDPFACRPAVD